MDHQTFAQLLGNYGEFVGAIAVVVTLGYLAVQVKHSKNSMDENTRVLQENRQLTRAEALDQFGRRWDSAVNNAMGSREAAAIFVRGNRDLSELDQVEQVIYTQQLTPLLNYHLSVHQMAGQGFLGLGDELTAAADSLIAGMLKKHPGARACWEVVKDSYPQSDHIDTLVENLGDWDGTAVGDAIVPRVQPA